MVKQATLVKNIFVTSGAGELGRVTIRQLVKRGHRVTGQVESEEDAVTLRKLGAEAVVANPRNIAQLSAALSKVRPEVVLNLIPQEANTLLHDGHNWQNFDLTLLPATNALLTAAKVAGVKFLIHASSAFLYGNTHAATEESPLKPPSGAGFTALVEAEKAIASGAKNHQIPLSLLRLGFLYGPQSRDLSLYEDSFNLRRPYYAGPANNLSNFLHFEDAVNALVLVVEKQPAGEIFNVVDGSPVSFGEFMDTFAHYLGKPRPGHIPPAAKPLINGFIFSAQFKVLELSTSVSNAKISQNLGWKPSYPDYKVGLEQTVQNWKGDVAKAKL
ncbi:MAG: NAD(P)-dependent oxidoreductase [Chloroflexi bacterium]|nr:NAD(P)-dependent oxidoreductase [Chloroflexota bacterium]